MTRILCLVLGLLPALVTFVSAAEPGEKRATENVILLMTDGLRWQEMFTGAEEALMNKENGSVDKVDELKAAYWRDTPEARREALMPFLWSVVAKQGQIYGNQHKGSTAKVTNGHHFSYPGYNETLCGFPDPRVDSNKKIPNLNVTVFEWLSRKPKYNGTVGAVGCWDVFPYIFNTERCGFFVNAGYDPLIISNMTPKLEMLNTLKAETPRRWGAEPFDPITFHSAMEYFHQHHPRIFFLSLNETDSWGHEGKYKEYLDAAHRVDGYFKTLWETVQSIPQYQGKTSIIFSPDHGRGDAPVEWRKHGEDIARSEYIWVAAIGPDTPALGERSNVPLVTQSQVAATLAGLLGEDYCASVPEAGKPIADILGQK